MINCNELKNEDCAVCVHKDICKYRVLVTQAITDMKKEFENRCENLPIKIKIRCDNFVKENPTIYRKMFERCD